MLLLVTGASGVGKTTVRLRLQNAPPGNVGAHELFTLVPPFRPRLPPAWRQEVIDTSDRSPAEVADAVLAWCRGELAKAATPG